MKKIILISATFVSLMWFTTFGQIIYTDIEPDTTIYIPSTPVDTHQVFIFDLDSNGEFDFGVSTFFGDNPHLFRYSLIGRYSSTLNQIYGYCLFGTIQQLYLNDTINSNLEWGEYGFFEYFEDGVPPQCHYHDTNIYVGLQLLKGDTVYYGWVRVDADANSVTIKDYAYNSQPNEFILAGQIITTVNDSLPSKSVIIKINGNSIIIEPVANMNETLVVTIYALQGKEIFNATLMKNRKTFDMSKAGKGIYLVKITGKNFVYGQKIIIK